ncbi:hypothetical protein [Streptomyces sp. NPDC051992]|uniref:hypothetical protein n=1 Tax=Streptomyces sp. NPDC051992 TaxID=3161012 RepID=UPI00343E0602
MASGLSREPGGGEGAGTDRAARRRGPRRDDEVAAWRRVVNYAKRHGLEPAGKRIEKVPHGGLGLFLAEGPHPIAQSQRPKEGGALVPVPSRLGHLHPMVTALKGDESWLVMPSALRRRSLPPLHGLAAEAVRRGILSDLSGLSPEDHNGPGAILGLGGVTFCLVSG